MLIVFVIAGGALLLFQARITELERDPSKIPPEVQTSGKIPLRHSYESGIHRYRGQITLDHSCYAVDTSVTRDHRVPGVAVISITTTDITIRQPVCAQIKTPYVFDAVVNEPDATKNLTLKLFVNGVARDYALIESSWTDPANSVVVPVQPFVQ